jgi:hypothetical protein
LAGRADNRGDGASDAFAGMKPGEIRELSK